MSEHDFELGEAPHRPLEPDSDRLQESVFATAMTTLGGFGGAAGIASFVCDRIDRRSDRAAMRAELDAQRDSNQRAQHIAYRRLIAQTQGLDALDRLDGFGVDDDYYPGFGVDDDYYPGFAAAASARSVSTRSTISPAATCTERSSSQPAGVRPLRRRQPPSASRSGRAGPLRR
jgi:hypothetical protein